MMEQLSEHRRLGRFLLICGVVAGPFFYLVVLLQMATRKGFDITRHPISLLSLGSGGWVQADGDRLRRWDPALFTGQPRWDMGTAFDGDVWTWNDNRGRLSGRPLAWISSRSAGRSASGIEQQRFIAWRRFFIGVFILDRWLFCFRQPVPVDRSEGVGALFRRDRSVASADYRPRDGGPRCHEHYVRAGGSGRIRLGFSHIHLFKSHGAASNLNRNDQGWYRRIFYR
jgi:hypothetical protein